MSHQHTGKLAVLKCVLPFAVTTGGGGQRIARCAAIQNGPGQAGIADAAGMSVTVRYVGVPGDPSVAVHFEYQARGSCGPCWRAFEQLRARF
jgi:hypothetical protein